MRTYKYFFIILMFVVSGISYAQSSNLWITLKPNAGSVYQINEDITINNGVLINDISSGNISVSQATINDELRYSITYTDSDFDNNGIENQVSFDLKIKGYREATYNYSTETNASSVTDYGLQSDVTIINNTWGVFGDFDIDAGESLVYEIENFTINGVSSDFSSNIRFSIFNLIETNGGRDHTMVFGFGNDLESFEIDVDKSVSPLGINTVFSLTGAGSLTTTSREIAISSLKIKIEINGQDTTFWDVTDYATFEKGPTLYHNYPTQTEKKTTLPKFSWNKIPRWVAVRNSASFTEEDVTSIANNYQLVMLEKANQQGFQYIEDGVENAATRIKAINPDLTTLFYYNTRINYFNYEANIEYNENAADWSTYEDGEIYLFKDLYYWYNHDVEAMRNWWVDTCVTMANLDVIDGVFVDKITNPDANGDLYDTDENLANNYVKMLSDLNDELPANKLLVGNTLRNEREGGARALMEIMDGSYLERWDIASSEQSTADAIAVSIQLMREALQKGKMINLQTNPSYNTDEEEPTDDDELMAYTKENIHFPLAVFLIIAEENAYFSYTTGVNALSSSSDLWDTSFIDEFHYFLGEPLADPVKNGYIYERSFENLDLWVNIETKETVFNWKDKTILSTDIPSFNNTIDLYPNPVNSTFRLSKKITSAIVYNMLGQEMMQFSNNRNQYDISSLKNGFFIVKVVLENSETKIIRFVKNKP
ncbi:putative glycoside hydrolase [Polaribacter sp. Hel1_85]|uniref:putative glycoside hydrolase n=1 Tax=Polaribacter sp. Hel1_85 TaxID=1250005 RepID=UPI00052CB94D|nr:putative glycoside hydrolase [Polaribacter sp. Hel1_85]KGL62193.1 hypothetical protein PHEL85_1981 [Polaribacter sp. Hel1_85]